MVKHVAGERPYPMSGLAAVGEVMMRRVVTWKDAIFGQHIAFMPIARAVNGTRWGLPKSDPYGSGLCQGRP